jgi:hypothetical protein
VIATRIRCTESELDAAFAVLGLGAAPTATNGADALSLLHGSGLLDTGGRLTNTAAVVLPIVAAPKRVVAVSSIGPGDGTPAATNILLPRSEGPIVFRGDDRDGVDLVAVSSPTAALALLDEMLLITGLPSDDQRAGIASTPGGWIGLVAMTDALRCVRLKAEIERAPEPPPVVDETILTSAVAEGRRAADSRWLAGSLAAVQSGLFDDAVPNLSESLGELESEGLVERAGAGWTVTPSGMVWVDRLISPVRVSHIRVVELQDGAPAEIGAITLIRAPLDIVLVSEAAGEVTITTQHRDVTAAMVRAVLVAAGEDAG